MHVGITGMVYCILIYIHTDNSAGNGSQKSAAISFATGDIQNIQIFGNTAGQLITMHVFKSYLAFLFWHKTFAGSRK